MSALGQRQTFWNVRWMSALPPKADIADRDWHVHLVPEADISLFDCNAHSPLWRDFGTCSATNVFVRSPAQ